MKYTGPIYRPPIEADTVLLQVTQGCTHNKCTFCTMYKDIQFHMESLEQIEKDLIEAKEIHSSLERIYLLNADPFALSANILKNITDLIIQYFPMIKVITMYAAVRNIKSKSDEELLMLKRNRIDELWVGVETGNEESLNLMNKGHNLNDAYIQLERLNKVGIKHNDMLILGEGGANTYLQCAKDTVKLVNKTKPNLIGFATMGLFQGSKLTKMAQEGIFTSATELEVLLQLKEILSRLDVNNMMVYADHSSNTTGLRGMFPRDKKIMIDRVDYIIDSLDKKTLNSYIKRYSM
jgi:radical SAM superfamily enzyme YgiQ (UPF0313 family)